jgi:hypothetical protein
MCRRRFPIAVVVLAALAAAGGLVVEAGVRWHVHEARGAFRRALGRRATPADAADLAAKADAKPSAETYRAASLAAGARGDLEGAARFALLAQRVAPSPENDRAAERALDGAVYERLRPTGDAFLLAGGAVLLLAGFAARARARRRRARTLYATHLEGTLAVRPFGPSPAIDLFLRPRGGYVPRVAPSPGPSLSVVLSCSHASRSIRLPTRHDVREDAVRVRLSDTTLRELASHPGTWRAQARLDGRLVAETRVEVPVAGLRVAG